MEEGPGALLDPDKLAGLDLRDHNIQNWPIMASKPLIKLTVESEVKKS